MSNNNEERRCFRLDEELRIVEKEGEPAVIRGLAVPYDQESEDLGGYVEVIRKGAFSESIRSDRDMRADVEHDTRTKLGRRSKGTLAFSEDGRGVWAEITIPNTTTGKDALEEVRNGLLDAMSITFLREPISAKFEEKDSVVYRTITKGVLTGVTLTAFPAYPQTADTLTLRSLAEWQRSEEGGEEDEYDPEIAEANRKGIAACDIALVENEL